MDETILTLILAVFASSGFWAFLSEIISKPRQRELLAQISATNGRIESLEAALQADRADRQRERKQDQEDAKLLAAELAREEIIRASDECYNGVKHSREFFLQTLRKIDVYEDYCADHPRYQNSQATTAIARIKDIYKELDANHGFL